MNVKHLTVEMVRSYAQACRDLNSHIELLISDGFDLAVIPSRGAHPFLQGANSYAHSCRAEHAGSSPFAPLTRLEKLYLPFTADIADDQPVTSSSIRSYWSRVLAAILRGDKADPSYRFYECVRKTAGALAVGQSEVRGRKHGRFIFVDTVLSGRAITEIFTAFAAYGLNDCHFILLVDEFGRRLRNEFKPAISQMEHDGRATLIPVEKIFTEDQGPAMSGIWTVTIPDLIPAVLRRSEFADMDGVAATLFYWEVRTRKDESNTDITVSNAILNTLLHCAVSDASSTPAFLEGFQRHVSGARLQRKIITKAIAEPLIRDNLGIGSIDVSSTHVIRGLMDKKRIDVMLRQFS